MSSIRTGLAVLALAFCAAATPLPALAQMKLMMTVERFQKMAAREEAGAILIAHYLHAFTQAMESAHFDYVQHGLRQKRLYCVPAGTDVKPLDIRDDLLREFAARPDVYKPTTPIGPAILEIIRRKYPCS